MAPTGRLEGPDPRRGRGGPGRPGARAPRRVRWVLAGLLLALLLEIVVVILVGQWIGPWWTVGALIAMGLLGSWLLRREGGRSWRRLQDAVRSGQPPANELTDTALVFAGGMLLLAPGFVSDVLGLFLILPFTRPLTRVWLQSLVAARVVTVMPPGAGSPGRRPPAPGGRRPRGQDSEDVIEGEIVSEEDTDPGHRSDPGPRGTS